MKFDCQQRHFLPKFNLATRDESSNFLQLTIVAIFLCVAMLLTPRAEAASPELIKSFQGNQCLDVAFSRSNPGAHVLFYYCNNTPNQRWTLRPAANGNYKIIVEHTGFCLDVALESTEDGASLMQYPCNESAGQLWKFLPVHPFSSGEATARSIVNVRSGLCIQPNKVNADGVADAALRNCQGAITRKQAFDIDSLSIVAILCEHVNYKGSCQRFTPGRYNHADLLELGVGNDRLSSVKVTAGYRVELYQHANFEGRVVNLTEDTPSLVDLKFNDAASSMIVYGRGR